MANFQWMRVKLTNTSNKNKTVAKTVAKNKTETILRTNNKNVEDE